MIKRSGGKEKRRGGDLGRRSSVGAKDREISRLKSERRKKKKRGPITKLGVSSFRRKAKKEKVVRKVMKKKNKPEKITSGEPQSEALCTHWYQERGKGWETR